MYAFMQRLNVWLIIKLIFVFMVAEDALCVLPPVIRNTGCDTFKCWAGDIYASLVS